MLGLTALLALLTPLESRRVRIQPVEEEDDQDIQYYNDPQDVGTHRQVVLVSQDDYNGLYGQSGVSRNAQDNYIPASRQAASRASFKDVRPTKETQKAPPVQTIRNYNKVGFTFCSSLAFV